MATIQLPSLTFIDHSPAAKTSFRVRSGPLIRSLWSSRSGSIAIKCNSTKNGGNATANKNNNKGLEDLLSAYSVELGNKDGPAGFVDSLRKAAQRVVQPEAETNKMKQVISELITRDEEVRSLFF